MPLTDDDLHHAQHGDTAATRLVFAEALPQCGRLAYSLTGLESSGRHALKKLVAKSRNQFSAWRDPGEVRRWFLHQTILQTRDHRTPHELDADVLMRGVGGPDVVAYRALVAGLRKLTAQQQEAFVLVHAEGMDLRQSAIAMDCSNQAASTHLESARAALKPLVGEHFTPLVDYLARIHRGQDIPLPDAPQRLAGRIRTGRTLRLIGRAIAWTIVIGFVAVLAYGAWWIYPRIKT